MDKISRCDDMHPLGKGVLSLVKDNEGDIHIQIVVDNKKNNEDYQNYHRVSLEFVSNNTQSPNTIKALENLMLAIEKDNKKYPKKMWPPTSKI